MSEIKFSNLLDKETIEFFNENLSMAESIEDQTGRDAYALSSKEEIDDLSKEDLKNHGILDRKWLIKELYTAKEEAENAFKAVEKIIYIKNALNVGKHIDPNNLDSVIVDNTGTIFIGIEEETK